MPKKIEASYLIMAIQNDVFEAAREFAFHHAYIVSNGTRGEESPFDWTPEAIRTLRKELFATLKDTGWTPIHTYTLELTKEYGVKQSRLHPDKP